MISMAYGLFTLQWCSVIFDFDLNGIPLFVHMRREYRIDVANWQVLDV